MRIFLSILILIFSFYSWTQADDIREFEIEGMSIEDSLLDHINLGTIKNARKYEYKNDNFYTIDLFLDKFEIYDAVQIHLKKNDELYKIYGIGGGILFGDSGVYFPESEKMCKKQLDIIEKDVDKIFFNADKQSAKFVGQGDYDPEALRDEVYYTIETGVLYLQCVTWSKEIKKKEQINDNLRLTIMNLEFNTWFENEAY